MQYDNVAADYHAAANSTKEKEWLELETVGLPGIDNPDGWQIADIGCGSGVQAQYLLKRFPAIKQYHGFDNSKAMLLLAEELNMPAAVFTLSDMHDITAEDNSFDFVYSRHTLHYSVDMPKAMSEIHRILKPGAKAYVKVAHPIYDMFCKTSHDYATGELANFRVQSADLYVTHPTHMLSEYINAAQRAGLNIISIDERFGQYGHLDGFHIPTALVIHAQKLQKTKF